MSWFARIEQACAAFIERTFAKTFPSDLEPAQIARKLVSTMEARTRGDDGHLFAPGSYVVYVNPEDLSRLSEHTAYLEREWGELLRDMAGRVGVYFFDGGPKVQMQPRESVPLGAVDVMVASDVTIHIASVTQNAAKRFHLRMLKGVPAYGVYFIEGTVTVGRSEESDIFLVDPSVSRNHAEIDLDADGPVVRDLASTNGTFINGERVESSTRAALGDVLTFGNTQLRLEARE
ncbi:MAG: FhaA domain-containing protein [Candidatus Baltobacteraceae bacterium]